MTKQQRFRLSPVGAALLLSAALPMTARAVDFAPAPDSSTLRNPPAQFAPDTADIVSGFYPAVTVSVAHDSNVLRSSDANKESDTSVVISPELFYKSPESRHAFQIGYRGDYSYYSKLSDNNALDHTLAALMGLDLTERFKANLNGRYVDGVEARGAAGSRISTSPTPDRFHEAAGGFGFTYGRRTNTLQLGADYSKSQLRYVNNNQEARDRDADAIRGTVYYNIGPKTHLLAQVIRRNINYINHVAGLSDLSGKETSYFAGITWEATAITRGMIKVGHTKKQFDDPTLSDYNGAAYEGRIEWKPKPYSTIQVYAARNTAESNLAGASYIIGDSYGASWTHELTERWHFNIFADKYKDKYSNSDYDDIKDYGAGVGFKMLTWLDLTLSYTRTDASSNIPGATYADDLVMFTATARRQ